MGTAIKQFTDLFKLRIGFVISFTALAGVAVAPGSLAGWKIAVLGLAVLISSASAGAFNQYVERDLDVLMKRTSKRPFVTGALTHGPFWMAVILVMLAGSVLATALVQHCLGAVCVSGRIFLCGGVHCLAEAPYLDEHRDRRIGRQFLSAGRCGCGQSSTQHASADFGGNFVFVDTSTFLEHGDRIPQGL